jgi:hypothetical protein
VSAPCADLRLLSDAALIGRFRLVCTLEQALDVPYPLGGVRAAVAGAARSNHAEMLDIVDDLVRRVVLRGQGPC